MILLVIISKQFIIRINIKTTGYHLNAFNKTDKTDFLGIFLMMIFKLAFVGMGDLLTSLSN